MAFNANWIPKIMFNNGQTCPFIGLGTFEGDTPSGKIQDAVKSAICAGYRLFDCAYVYSNEDQVGHGICEKIRDGTVCREDLFITSKLWNTYHTVNLVEDGFKNSLGHLGLEYLDLYSLQSPMAWKPCAGLYPKNASGKLQYNNTPFTDTWKQLEKIQESGRVRSLGISNFNSRQVKKLLEIARVKPVVNQVEVHPYLPNKLLQKICEENGIVLEALSPLGSPSRPWKCEDEPILLEDRDVKCIAENYGKTPAQVLLRYLYQRCIISVPKSTSPDRISSNIRIWDFCLDDDDMRNLNTKSTRIRYYRVDEAQNHPDYPFNVVY